jgi:hypothetical protein
MPDTTPMTRESIHAIAKEAADTGRPLRLVAEDGRTHEGLIHWDQRDMRIPVRMVKSGLWLGACETIGNPMFRIVSAEFADVVPRQDLPEIGRTIEIDLANGETIRGVVTEHDNESYDLLIKGPHAVPMAHRACGSFNERWRTGTDEDLDADERRVAWRYTDTTDGWIRLDAEQARKLSGCRIEVDASKCCERARRAHGITGVAMFADDGGPHLLCKTDDNTWCVWTEREGDPALRVRRVQGGAEMPEVGRYVEVTVASGEVLQGTVQEVKASGSILLTGPNCGPKRTRPTVWWWTFDGDGTRDERRVSWRYAEDPGHATDGRSVREISEPTSPLVRTGTGGSDAPMKFDFANVVTAWNAKPCATCMGARVLRHADPAKVEEPCPDCPPAKAQGPSEWTLVSQSASGATPNAVAGMTESLCTFTRLNKEATFKVREFNGGDRRWTHVYTWAGATVSVASFEGECSTGQALARIGCGLRDGSIKP